MEESDNRNVSLLKSTPLKPFLFSKKNKYVHLVPLTFGHKIYMKIFSLHVGENIGLILWNN